MYCVYLLWLDLGFKNNLSNLNFIILSCLNNFFNTLINIFKKFVKEQRVDGSWGLRKIKNVQTKNTFLKSKPLRYTLMGFERNYQVKSLSNLNNKR